MKLLVVMLAIASEVAAQEVSIRPSPPGAKMSTGSTPTESYYCRNCFLENLLSVAFGAKGHRISGPKFLETERFDVDVKTPGRDESYRMNALRNALEERFHLQTHRETRKMPGFELLIAPDGLKLRPDSDTPPSGTPGVMLTIPTGAEGGSGPAVRHPWDVRFHNGGLTLTGTETLDAFARQLAVVVKKPVTDLTGLTGKYDFGLSDFTATQGHLPLETLIARMKDQLGLTLESKDEPFEILVIDRIDKTPGN